MLDYEIWRLIWWGLLGVLLVGFAIMDGLDFGSAALIPFLGKTDEERRVMINTVGPVWEGNQVWLLLGGGAIFAAFPAIYAVAFSGFYLAMLIVLAMLILRPVAFKFRSKMPGATWRRFWDTVLCVSGFVPPVIFGVAVGNAILGAPFTLDDTMRMTYEGTFFGLLSPFALLAGVLSLLMILTQGATWIALKTEGEIEARARKLIPPLVLLTLALFVVGGFWVATGIEGYKITSEIDPNGPSNPLLKTATQEVGFWFHNYTLCPLTRLVPAVVGLGGLVCLGATAARRPLTAFIGSSLTIAAIITTVGVSMFPFLLPSSVNPSASLTVWDATSSKTTLQIMTFCALIFVPIILAYTGWVYAVLRGKVTKAYIREQSGNLY